MEALNRDGPACNIRQCSERTINLKMGCLPLRMIGYTLEYDSLALEIRPPTQIIPSGSKKGLTDLKALLFGKLTS